MFTEILWGLLALILVSLLYFSYTLVRDAKYFRDREVLYLGNGTLQLTYNFLKGKPMMDFFIRNYEKVKEKKQRFAGGMDFGSPNYLIVDLDLAKQILVKDFDHFVNRRKFPGGKANVILEKMLLSQEGERWKALRSKMSPTFTTGKIRRMFSILDQSGKNMVSYLQGEISKSAGVVDLQESYSKYTMDVIASVAFGIDSKAFDQTDPSLFEQMGSKLQSKFSVRVIAKAIIFLMAPKLAASLGISLIDSEPMDFFSGVIKSAIKYREETKEKRNDFLQLMLEARSGHLKADEGGELSQFEKDAMMLSKDPAEISGKVNLELDDDDIVAQSILFIFGGFDTTKGLLLFAAYNLAVYQDIQEQLYQEVKKSVGDNDGELTYDSVHQMEFMEMFICETLRYYPPLPQIERRCTKSFKVPDSNLVIEKGTHVSFPIVAIQRDAEHFPDPEKFDPERFSAENRSKIHPCAYMPFGAGPRNCIAMRLALVESKMAVAHLVLNFLMEPSEKTPIPMKFSLSGTLKPEGGLWLKLQPRKY